MKLQIDLSSIEVIDIMIELIKVPLDDELDFYTKEEIESLESLRRLEFLKIIDDVPLVVK